MKDKWDKEFEDELIQSDSNGRVYLNEDDLDNRLGVYLQPPCKVHIKCRKGRIQIERIKE